MGYILTPIKINLRVGILMNKGKNKNYGRDQFSQKNQARQTQMSQQQLGQPKQVPSLLDAMEDGNEYGSIVSLVPANHDLVVELRRALKDLEAIRKRPCVCYIGNVVKPTATSSINDSDDLPFNEMISKMSATERAIDVLIVTNGGSGQQVSQFVDTLRNRFDSVEFILPYKCMSAGTLWSLSGDKIWMDERAFLGPIDPQVLTADGSYVPAQSILVLVKQIQLQADEIVKKGGQIPWTLVRLLDNIDTRKLGDAISLTNYAAQMAADFLEKYKFKNWNQTSSGNQISPEQKEKRAIEVANLLASNEHWKSHGHGISREVLDEQVRILIDKIETVKGLERAVRRFWALIYYVFDRSNAAKVFLSQNYCLIRNNVG